MLNPVDINVFPENPRELCKTRSVCWVPSLLGNKVYWSGIVTSIP